MKLIHQNAQRATNKEDELAFLCDELSPDALVVSETGYRDTTVEYFKIRNYDLANFYCRKIHLGGGVAIFTKHYINYEHSSLSFTVEKHFEMCAINLCTASQKFTLIGVYRSPSGCIEIFFERFEALLSHIIFKKIHFVIMGDFNINILDLSSDRTRRFQDLLRSFGLCCSVSAPTRVTATSQTAIDNVITNITQTSVSVIKTAISDHEAQEVLIREPPPEGKAAVSIRKRDLRPQNISLLNTKLKENCWFPSDDSLSLEGQFESFQNSFMFYVDTYCPLKMSQSTYRSKNCSWITRGILVSRQKLKFYSAIAKGPSSTRFMAFFRRYKLTYRKVILAAKAHTALNKLKSSKNVSKTAWKIIKENKNNSTCSKQIILSKGGQILSEPDMVASEFNQFFTSVAQSNQPLPLPNQLPLNSPVGSMVLGPVSEHDVERVIKQLPPKRTNDGNNVSTFLLKQCYQHILGPLTYLINLSFSSGVFPSHLKMAKVIPIYKKDDPKLVTNYRPISILPVLSKVFEKLFLNQLVKYLDKHKILSQNQFGFRAGMSTTDAVVSLVDMIVEGMESHDRTLSVFLDLSKAFDCVDHSLLKFKLQNYGIRGIPLLWLDSYLENRLQSVSISDHFSPSLKLKYGVPQGSILGPILFLLYVNDAGSSLLQGRLVQYADDTTLFFRSPSKESLEIQAFAELNAVIQYFNRINLSVNEEKTKFINFSLRPTALDQRPSVMINSCELDEAESVKFLGIHLDRGITWNTHIDYIASRVSSGLFVLRRLSKYCPKQVLLMTYYGLIYPHLTYGLPLWGGCSNFNFNRLFRLQKQAIRMIANLKPRESCKPAFVDLGLLTLPCLYILETSFYCINKCVLTQGRDIHSHYTRGRNNYRTESHRTVVQERLPSQAGVSFLNSLPNSFKLATTPKAFKIKLKHWLAAKAFYSIGEFRAFDWENDDLNWVGVAAGQ